MTITRNCMSAAFALFMLGIGSAYAQRSDSNSLNYAESFETLGNWGTYTNINITNGWYSPTGAEGDKSVITNIGVYVFTNCSKPLESAAHSNVLKLATEGTTLTNLFGAVGVGIDVSTNIVYLDTMVQFVASETAPTACGVGDTGIKAAVYADVNTNLVIYHGVVQDSPSSGLAYNTNTVTTILLNANWYRLTVVFDATCVADVLQPVEMFQVKINNVAAQSATAYNDDWKASWQKGGPETLPSLSPTGTWFRSATAPSGLNKKLTAIAFQGTGYIDDLVVSFAQPTYTNNALDTSFFNLVVNISGSGTAKTNGIALASGVPVQVLAGSSPTIVYEAAEWFRITSLSSNSVPVPGVPVSPNTALLMVYTQYLSGVSAPITNNVVFAKPVWSIYQYVTNGSAPANGSIVAVTNGDNYAQTFSGNNEWFELTSLLEDGINPIGVPGVNTQLVTFSQVQGDHTFAANFFLPSYAVTAVVDGGNGFAEVSPASPISKGVAVKITYTGTNWYRVSTLTTNSQTVAGASGNRYVTVDVANVVGSIAATGTFSLAESNPFGVNTAWLQKWGHDESAATNGANTINGVVASMSQQLLLDVDPYIPESATFKVNAIGVTGGTNVAVTVGLQVNSGNHTNINGYLSLESKTALTNASWSPLGGTSINGAVFTNGVHTYNFVDTVSNDFYKAVIQ